MNRVKLEEAAATVRVSRKKAAVAEVVLARRRADLDDATRRFVEAGGTVTQLAQLLGVGRSAAHRRIDRVLRG